MVKVYVLVDNKVVDLRPPGMKAEWGFSAYIDAGEPVLMDSGQSDIAFRNMLVRELELPQKMVLSHGHYDHTGGLMSVLRPKMRLYAHPHAFLPRFYKSMHVGIPFVRERIEAVAEVVEVTEPVEVAKTFGCLEKCRESMRKLCWKILTLWLMERSSMTGCSTTLPLP